MAHTLTLTTPTKPLTPDLNPVQTPTLKPGLNLHTPPLHIDDPGLSCGAFFAPQNFLDNFSSSDTMVFVARSFLLFQMITVYPLLGYLVRVQLMGQIFGNHYPR